MWEFSQEACPRRIMRAESGCSGLRAGRNTCLNNPLKILAVKESKSRIVKRPLF